ncbi:MAG: FkbM family methyltransferase [Sphingobacteriales bacterium]|nr:FkbM family methyltransferase [Sphingobacteriales bacterium]
MRKFLSWVFSKFPEGELKDKVRQFIYNFPAGKEFTVRKKGKIWELLYPGFTLKFVPDSVPYHVSLTNYIFLHHFPEEPVDYFVDAGAYIGSFSVYVAKKYRQVKKVIAMEPDPATRQILERNLRLNELSDFEIIPAGLWSSREVLTFYPDQKLASSVFQQGEGGRSIKISVDSLDDILHKVTGKRIFIKMNIEGAELEALRACNETVKNNKVHFAIASDHTVNGELTCKKIQELCRAMNLSVTTFTRGKIITVYASNETVYSNPVT